MVVAEKKSVESVEHGSGCGDTYPRKVDIKREA